MAWQPALAVTSEVDSNTTLGTRNSNGDMHKNDSDKENASTNSPKLSLRKRFRLKMGLFKHLRSKPIKANDSRPKVYGHYISSPLGQDYTTRLDRKVLARIFAFVCPHTLDTSYQILDDVDLGDTCMLCNLRNLAQCARVCKAWHDPAMQVLYGSIRIDAVHYCPLEQTLRHNRAKKNRRSKYVARVDLDDDYVYDASTDPSQERMRLLADTLRSNYWLGSLVKYLKLPYTIRESLNSDLTRAAGACPNLRYVDLATGFFAGESRFEMLRHEIWINCPDIRTMKYTEGSERYFKALGDENRWRNLEIITLEHLRVDVAGFRYIIASLPKLHTLILESLPDITDDIFSISSGISEFPALKSLELHSLPRVTSAGLIRYLTSSEVRNTLTDLTLDRTGVQITKLNILLAASTKLKSLTVVETVSNALPLDPIPPLQSPTLQTLHFEIQTHSNNVIIPPPADSYHHYLLTSIIGGSLPNLRALYVRDPSFPSALTQKSAHHNSKQLESVLDWGDSPTLPHSPRLPFDTSRSTSLTDLLGPPPLFLPTNVPMLANHPQPRRRTLNSMMMAPPPLVAPLVSRQLQPLEVYTKAQHEKEWLFAPMPSSIPQRPPPPSSSSLLARTPSQQSSGSGASTTTINNNTTAKIAANQRRRPQSTFNIEWATNARRSIFVADGEGGFLAVPDAPLPDRPRTVAGAVGAGEGAGWRPSSSPGGGARHSPTMPLTDPVNASPRPEAWEERWGVVRQRGGEERSVKKRRSWWDVHAGTGKRGSRADMWR